MSKPTLYLMLGYAGSGKTTVSQEIHKLTGAIHVWADHERHKMFSDVTHSHAENIKLYAHLNNQAAQLLSEGKSVIFDTNFNFYDDREHLRDIAEANNANTQLVWVQTPKALAKQRAITTDHAKRNTYDQPMPEERFNKMASHLQPPKEDESYVKIDGTNITTDSVKQILKAHNLI
jgi:predicted kinase